MKTFKVISLGLFLSATSAFAKTYQVNGMHCGGCEKNVERAVCSMKGIESCKASVVDAVGQVGKVELKFKPGQEPPYDEIKRVVLDGSGYELAGEFPVSGKAPKAELKK